MLPVKQCLFVGLDFDNIIINNMKTYTKTIEVTKPRLVIEYDESPENPRKWDNLGYFITMERDYNSPDDNSDIKGIVKGTAELVDNIEDHIRLIKKELEGNWDYGNVLAIYPVYRYEHGNVVYRRGMAQGFDYSNCGFYIVTDKSANILGTTPEHFEAVIDQELETYTKYTNGEVYGYTLYDEKGEMVDSCWGFYDIKDIKENLPEDWKDEDMSDYLIND